MSEVEQAELEVESSEPVVEESQDLRSMIESAFEQTESTESVESGRARDESGRFLAKDSQETVPPETIEEIMPPPVSMPGGWDPAVKAEWDQLPRNIQEMVMKRQTELQRGYSQASERAAQVEKTWAEVAQAIAPYKQKLDMHGLNEGALVKQILSVQQYLDNDPVEGIKWLASTYGLDLKQLAEYQSQQPQVPSYVQDLQRELQSLKQYQAQQLQAQQIQSQSNIEAQILAFANEADSAGNALRPHFGSLVDDIIPMVQYLKNTNPGMSNRELLQAAYDKAVWANPNTRQVELNKKQSEILSKQNAQKEVHLAKAKKAAKLVNGSAESSFVPKKTGDLRSMLEAAFEEQM